MNKAAMKCIICLALSLFCGCRTAAPLMPTQHIPGLCPQQFQSAIEEAAQ